MHKLKPSGDGVQRFVCTLIPLLRRTRQSLDPDVKVSGKAIFYYVNRLLLFWEVGCNRVLGSKISLIVILFVFFLTGEMSTLVS